MFRSAHAYRTCSSALACVVLLFGGIHGNCAEEQPISLQELKRRQEQPRLELRETERQLSKLTERGLEIEEELKSPDRKRTFAEIRKELDAITEERAKLHARVNDASERYDFHVIDFLKSRSVLFVGTANACGVIELLYPQFLGRHESTRLTSFPPQMWYEPEGSTVGIAKLIAGETEVAVLDRPLTDDERQAVERAFPDPKRLPREIAFGRAALAIVVHRGNRLQGMTMNQVEQVYRAKIEKWSRLGGAEQSISRLGAKHPLLSWWMFTNRILHGETIRFADEFKFDSNHLPQAEELHGFVEEQQSRFPGGGPFPCFENDAKLVEEVSKKPSAIGYCLLFASSERMKNVRTVPIASNEGDDPVPALLNGALSDTYPLQEVIWFLIHPDAPESTKAFVKYCTSSEAANTIKECGLWPEYELEKVRGEQRVVDANAGKGTPVSVCDLAGVGEALKAAALEFARAKMAVQVTLDAAGGSAEAAVAKLKAGEAELMVVDGGMEGALRGQGMEEGGAEMVLGSRAVGVVVHPGNAFNELTMDDLRQILAGKVDRWPGATGTAERIVLYGLPAANPLMPLVDRAMGANLKRAKVTVRPDSERVILSVAAQPGALGLVDLTKVARHETKVKLLAILQAGETEAVPPSPRDLPDDYPLAQPVHLRLSGKASEAAKSFFAFLNEGGGRDALLAGGLVPQPLPDATEAEVAAAYGVVDETQAAGPPAKVAAAKEDDSPATSAPDYLQDVLRGALGGSAGASPSGAAPAAAQAGADQTAESAAAESTPRDPNRPTPPPREAEKTEAITPAPGEGNASHLVAPQPPAGERDFAAWATAHAVPIGLVGLGVVAVAVALGSLGMKRARHRNEVMRRYRP